MYQTKKRKIISFVKEIGSNYNAVQSIISIPLEILETAETKEDIEDWLLTHNSDFIFKMRKAREDDLAGKGKSLSEIKRKLCIK